MKRSKFTEAQIVFALKQGVRVEEISRRMGITQATFYNWKKKYGGLGISELRRLKELERENTRRHKLKNTIVQKKNSWISKHPQFHQHDLLHRWKTEIQLPAIFSIEPKNLSISHLMKCQTTIGCGLISMSRIANGAY